MIRRPVLVAGPVLNRNKGNRHGQCDGNQAAPAPGRPAVLANGKDVLHARHPPRTSDLSPDDTPARNAKATNGFECAAVRLTFRGQLRVQFAEHSITRQHAGHAGIRLAALADRGHELAILQLDPVR
jgi:hypothetical protein